MTAPRRPRSLCPLAAILALVGMAVPGCSDEEPPDTGEVSWEPALVEDNRGLLDLGTVAVGETAQEYITATNNTDHALGFTLEVDLDPAIGFIASAPTEEVQVEPGDDFSFGPRFNPNANTPPNPTGRLTFNYGEGIVIYDVTATVP